MENSVLTDNELIDLIRNEDSSAFEVLYRRYWQKLFVTALNKTQDDDLSKEIVQEIFVDLWERRASLQITNVPAYLQTATRFKVISAYKAELQTQIEFLEIPTNQSTSDQLDLEDFERALSAAVQLLPEKTRDIFVLNRLENRTVKEIAATLQIPERTIEYHITQSLRFLRLHLQDFFLSQGICILQFLLYYKKNFFN
ncbi:sigma-70 family RNA polymerase sigma factor [Arcicella aquatica]|uniref:Sigma-70 family RNA polymerase sigma factor n=1 Tax=Arcicella aquatica TaxID=217141 RepID=A0ABU5QQC6_9BACT|nr:sigma-70 family RNA polymerase sigma factor [Arcicella aquatica]MEA5258939.1 sigma-70 family RNA polymerase sigma factor [Arcicella aquatica]